MQHLEARNLIDASPLFRHMQPQETEAILAQLQPAHYDRGTLLLERGVWHGRLYIIATGQVSVLLQHNEPELPPSDQMEHPPYIVARLGPGECFGEISLITGEPPNATVRVEEDVTLWTLGQTDFLKLIGSCPTLLQNINSILSQRLTRANQQLLSQQAAEMLLLSLLDSPRAEREYSLAYHIADALAARTSKRVLLLELNGQDASICAHFAVSSEQVRPSLFACAQDHTLLQTHRAPSLSSDGLNVPAVATLTDTYEQVLTLDTRLFLTLVELALLYDYILLVRTQETPAHIIEALVEYQRASLPYTIKRAIRLVSAEALKHPTVTSSLVNTASIYDNTLFIMHIQERPTLGLQERYARQLEQRVERLLPADNALLERCWQEKRTPRQLAPDVALSKSVDFVARYIAHQTVGIAFGGGGARGFAHLGVLEGLLAHSVPLDYIAACSSGIITPGMYLLGKSLPESEKIFLEIQRHIVHWNFPRTAIFSNRGLKRMLRELCGEMRFEDLETPFAMVAVDLTTRSGVVLDHGPIWQAGLASVALPGIFPPMLIGRHVLVDAGMHDPVPIRLVRQMGADILLASELGEQGPPTLENATSWLEETPQKQSSVKSPHIIDLLLRTYDLAMATIGMHSIREADVVIRPKLHRVSLRQFSEGRKFVAAGREAVEQALPDLRKRLPWL